MSEEIERTLRDVVFEIIDDNPDIKQLVENSVTVLVNITSRMTSNQDDFDPKDMSHKLSGQDVSNIIIATILVSAYIETVMSAVTLTDQTIRDSIKEKVIDMVRDEPQQATH